MSIKSYYEDIFLHKIKRNKKILIKRFSCEIDIIFIDLKIVKDKNLSISTTENNQTYDIIIFENFFYSKEDINEVLQKYKYTDLLMFIENVSLTYKSSFNILKDYIGINLEYIYIGNIFDILRQNELKVIDSYRLESKNNCLLSQEVFLITSTSLWS
jgi:hypothetical protein